MAAFTFAERIKAAYEQADATGTDGYEWADAFDAACADLGLVYTGGPTCECPDGGDYGHLPHCGLGVLA